MQGHVRILPYLLRLTFQSLMNNKGMAFFMTNHWNKTIRVGLTNISYLLLGQGQGIEIVSNTREELLDDFLAHITSMAARMYGLWASKRQPEQIRRCVEDAYS